MEPCLESKIVMKKLKIEDSNLNAEVSVVQGSVLDSLGTGGLKYNTGKEHLQDFNYCVFQKWALTIGLVCPPIKSVLKKNHFQTSTYHNF